MQSDKKNWTRSHNKKCKKKNAKLIKKDTKKKTDRQTKDIKNQTMLNKEKILKWTMQSKLTWVRFLLFLQDVV